MIWFILVPLLWVLAGCLMGAFVHGFGSMYINGKEFVGIIFIWPLFLVRILLSVPRYLYGAVLAALRVFKGEPTEVGM